MVGIWSLNSATRLTVNASASQNDLLKDKAVLDVKLEERAATTKYIALRCSGYLTYLRIVVLLCLIKFDKNRSRA